MNLYEITSEFKDIEQQLIESGGELTPELEERLAINTNEFEAKMEAYAKIRTNHVGDCESIDSEIQRLGELKASKQKIISLLETRMRDALLVMGQQDKKGVWRLKTALFEMSSRKSSRVEIVNPDAIPQKYWIMPEPVLPQPYPSKDAIKEAISAGEQIDGAMIVVNYSIKIK